MKWLAELKGSGVNVKVLEGVPEILPHARWLWEAYELLTRKRTITAEGLQPIQMGEILAFATYNHVPAGAARDDLLSCISVMDQVFLRHVAKKRAEQLKAQERKGARGRGGRRAARRARGRRRR